MELRAYLDLVRERWKLIAVVWAIVFFIIFLLTLSQPRQYASRATYIIQPKSSILDQDVAGLVNSLSLRVEINSTYAEVARSEKIAEKAARKLDLPAEKQRGLSVESGVIPGTNVLQITVRGNDPQVVKDFLEAVSAETFGYLGGIYTVFEFKPLDPPRVPDGPLPTKTRGTLIIGLLAGLLCGIGVAIGSEILSLQASSSSQVALVDPETGANSTSYFLMRLRQEVSRSRRNDYPLTIAIIELFGRTNGRGPGRLMSDDSVFLVECLRPLLREEDLLASYKQNTFALLLPDLSADEAGELLKTFRRRFFKAVAERKQGEEFGLDFQAGIAGFSDDLVSGAELLKVAEQALQQAMNSVPETSYSAEEKTPVIQQDALH
jgi:GGDEF domain-containing protein